MPEILVTNRPLVVPPHVTRGRRSPERIIRPSQTTDNQISFLWQPGVVLAELVYEPGCEPGEGLAFVVRDEGEIRRCSTFSQSQYRPLRWIEDYARNYIIRLPNAAEPYGSIDELAEQVRTFIHRYFDADSVFESVATL